VDIQLAYTTAPMQRGSLAIRRPLCSRAAVFMYMCEDGGRWQSFFFPWRKIAKRQHWSKFRAENALMHRQISPSPNVWCGHWWGGMGVECVATGLSIGYTFRGPVQNCRQLSGNLPCEARHWCYKVQNWQQSQEIRWVLLNFIAAYQCPWAEWV
jgi:hypothetical protein